MLHKMVMDQARRVLCAVSADFEGVVRRGGMVRGKRCAGWQGGGVKCTRWRYVAIPVGAKRSVGL